MSWTLTVAANAVAASAAAAAVAVAAAAAPAAVIASASAVVNAAVAAVAIAACESETRGANRGGSPKSRDHAHRLGLHRVRNPSSTDDELCGGDRREEILHRYHERHQQADH